VLVALWSPKGGSGTSVVGAALSIVLARGPDGGARLADLDGDQPAILGTATDPAVGLADWLEAGPAAPTEALDRLTIEVVPGFALLPRGTSARILAPTAAAESGAALAVALRDGPVPTVVDCGRACSPATRAIVEVADVSVVVVRGCYLALRRALSSPVLERAGGVVLVDEKDRSLGARDVADVLGVPIAARVPVRPGIARAVDAGVLVSRLPEALARPAAVLAERLGLTPTRKDVAA
jgi:hypothetical protein